MSNNLPENILKECKEAFGMFDRNGDGSIEFSELSSVMRLLGNNPTKEEIQEVMSDLDADGSGQVDFDEFIRIMLKHWKDPVDEERELRDAFKVFDRDNDGYVVAEEIKYVMKNLGHDLTDADIEDIMRKADVNGDGRLDYEEFAKVMTSKDGLF